MTAITTGTVAPRAAKAGTETQLLRFALRAFTAAVAVVLVAGWLPLTGFAIWRDSRMTGPEPPS